MTGSESRPPAAADTARPSVGFAGLGIMGSRMAAQLAQAGFPLTVYNRTAAVAREWAAAHGAQVAGTPAQLAAASDVVVSIVVDADAVRDVLLGRDGVAAGARPGLLCVDMSTIGPQATLELGAELARSGVALLDAPVTGSAPRAENGTLTIMVGGEADDFRRAQPLFEAMGQLVVHAGALGQGQAIKIINNAVAAVNAITVGEALIAADAGGVDLDALVTVMGAGSGASAMLELKAAPMRAHDFTTLFKLEHMLKDVRLCLDAAQAAGVPFESARRAAELLLQAGSDGHAQADFAAVLEALEKASRHRVNS